MWNKAPWANGIDRYSDDGLGVIAGAAESRRPEAIVVPKADSRSLWPARMEITAQDTLGTIFLWCFSRLHNFAVTHQSIQLSHRQTIILATQKNRPLVCTKYRSKSIFFINNQNLGKSYSKLFNTVIFIPHTIKFILKRGKCPATFIQLKCHGRFTVFFIKMRTNKHYIIYPKNH